LAQVRGFGPTLLRAQSGERELRQAVTVLETESGRLQHLFEDLQTLSRLELDRDSLELQNANLLRTVQETQAAWIEAARERGIRMEVRGNESEAISVFDVEKLQRTIDSFFAVAVKLTPTAGSIVVELARAERRILVAFHSSTRSHPPDELHRILDRMETSGRGKGTHGLPGLYGSRRVIEAHGGEVEAERSATGTTFRFWIPVPKASAPGSAELPQRGAFADALIDDPDEESPMDLEERPAHY
jgi:signal transduction histidine kinase